MTNQATYRRGTFDSQAGTLAVAAAAAIDRRISEPGRIVAPVSPACPAVHRRLSVASVEQIGPWMGFRPTQTPRFAQGPTRDKETRATHGPDASVPARADRHRNGRGGGLRFVGEQTGHAGHADAGDGTQVATTTRLALPPQTFISHRYRFAMTLTNAWLEHDALVDWNGKKLQGLESAAFANFTDPATDRTLAPGDAE